MVKLGSMLWMRKHARLREFPIRKPSTVQDIGQAGQVQQGSTATGTESSRLQRTSMDGQQVLERVFSNVGSMCLQDGMQKVRTPARTADMISSTPIEPPGNPSPMIVLYQPTVATSCHRRSGNGRAAHCPDS
jgi:hypothetical protein